MRIKKDDGPDDKQDEAKSPPSESPDCKSPTTSIMDKGKGAAEPAAEPKEIVKRMYPGDTFGEVALLHACPRCATLPPAPQHTTPRSAIPSRGARLFRGPPAAVSAGGVGSAWSERSTVHAPSLLPYLSGIYP